MIAMAALLSKLVGRLVDAREHEVAQLVHDRERRPSMRTAPVRRLSSMTALIIAPIHSRPGSPKRSITRGGKSSRREHPGPQRIERVVGEVGDPIREPDAERLGRGRRRLDLPAVRPDAVAHLPRQVRVLEHLPDPDALGGVVPAVGREVRRERLLSRVPERGVPDVVAERDRLGQWLVQAQRGGERARHLGDLHRVRQARDEVVALRIEEDLGLVLQPPERLGVDDPIPVALEGGPVLVRLLRRALGRDSPPTSWPPAEALLIGLAGKPVPPPQSALGADLLHRSMMPWGFTQSGR